MLLVGCFNINLLGLIVVLIFFINFLKLCKGNLNDVEDCVTSINPNVIKRLSKDFIPPLEGKRKGEAGKIGVIGGSTEYTGAPYFAAISALKTGADLVFVITTESAAPVIKSYSPELIVYPYLNKRDFYKINVILGKMDVIVIGPGLGREDDTLKMTYDLLETCKNIKKPLVIDADGLFAIFKNVTVVKDYPSPGIILTPNYNEAQKLKEAVAAVKDGTKNWFAYWGKYVSVLTKSQEDNFISVEPTLNWTLSELGSGRRAGGQGDILSGSLGTFYNWALKFEFCKGRPVELVAQSVSSYAAAKLTRKCNYKGFELYGRSMTASDMINQIHFAFDYLFTS